MGALSARARDDSGPDYLLIPAHKQSGGNVAAVGDSPAEFRGPLNLPPSPHLLLSSSPSRRPAVRSTTALAPSTPSGIDAVPSTTSSIRHCRRRPSTTSPPTASPSTKSICHRSSRRRSAAIGHRRRPLPPFPIAAVPSANAAFDGRPTAIHPRIPPSPSQRRQPPAIVDNDDDHHTPSHSATALHRHHRRHHHAHWTSFSASKTATVSAPLPLLRLRRSEIDAPPLIVLRRPVH